MAVIVPLVLGIRSLNPGVDKNEGQCYQRGYAKEHPYKLALALG